MADKNQGRTGSSNRGFAAMDQEKQRQIARQGGESVPAEKRSFSQDPALAAEAGRKGGQNVAPQDRSFSQNRGLAAEAGRKGGQSRGRNQSLNRGTQPSPETEKRHPKEGRMPPEAPDSVEESEEEFGMR